MTVSPHAPLEQPTELAFLPLLYVAWADGELDPAEIEAIRARVRARAPLTDGATAALDRWLDPSRPPSAQDLQDLLDAVRRGASALSEAQKLTLEELGVELARVAGRDVEPPERRALDALAEALGVGRQRSRRLLAVKRPPPPEAPPRPAGAALEPLPDDAAAALAAALAHRLEGEHADVRARVRALLEEPAFAPARALGLDRAAYRALVLEWARELARRGLGALAYPEGCGGAGSIGAFVAAFETLAFGDLSLLVKFGVQFGLFGGAIQNLGGRHHHDRHLAAAGTLALPGSFAMTETGHGSNVEDLETEARYDEASGCFVLRTPSERARKDYIGNAARDGRLAVVFAQLVAGGARHGVHAFLVPIRADDGSPSPGVRIEDCGEKLGLNGVDNGRLWFDDVRVGRDALLDRFAVVHPDGRYESPIASPKQRFFTMLGTLVGGRVSVGLGALSAAKVALATAIRYATRRRQFGPPGAPEVALLDYPAHQRRLLPRLAYAYAAHFAMRDLARRYATSEPTGADRREVEALAAGLKALVTWHATDTIQACREACGGQGYLAENRFAALKADTDVFTTFEGDNTVLLQLVAKSLLTGLKRRFGDMDMLGMARYLAGRAKAAIVERNPLAVRDRTEEHLRDPAFHAAALRHREEEVLGSVGRRLKRRIGRGMDPFDAFRECQNHLLTTARAHVDRVLYDRFAQGVAETADAEVRALLAKLCGLFALSRLEQDRGWFLESGYFEPGKAKSIKKQVTKLCAELRPRARALVDAFGAPESCLGPIARSGSTAGSEGA